jgi:hypothetical protein
MGRSSRPHRYGKIFSSTSVPASRDGCDVDGVAAVDRRCEVEGGASEVHRSILSSLTFATELEDEVARQRGLKSEPAEPSLSTYATVLEREVALGHGITSEEDYVSYDAGLRARGHRRRLRAWEEAASPLDLGRCVWAARPVSSPKQIPPCH